MKEIIRSSAVLVLLSVLVGACGSAATTAAPVPTQAPTPTEVTEATSAPAPTEPPAPAPTEPPAEPKILRIRFDLDISNLDPAFYP